MLTTMSKAQTENDPGSKCNQTGKNVIDIKSAWEEIQNAVKVTPTMVFSVIGDSDSFVPRPWPRTVFQTALIEAAKSGGDSWILHSGSEQGVSKAVRDAYMKYGNKEFGTNNSEIHKDNKNRHIKLISITDKETEEKNVETVIRFKNGGNFLLEFEKFVSEQEVAFFSQKVDFRMPVPIAVVVCEGDIETIAHTAGALQNKLPVIIMKGSGKAADLILDYLETSCQLRKNAGIFLGIKFEDKNFQTLEEYLKIISKNRDLVGVFDLNTDDPLKLSNIVGEAVVRCWSMEKIHPNDMKGTEDNTKQTNEEFIKEKTAIEKPNANRLAITGSSIAWKLFSKKNSIQPEEKTINELLEGYKKETRPGVLNPKFTSPTSLPLYFYFGYQLLQESDLLQKCGHILLLEALKANRCDYVRVLLDQGVKLRTKNLPELYEQTVSCKECRFKKDDCLHMQWILKQILEKEAKTLCHRYGRAMEKIEEGGKRDKYIKKIKEIEMSFVESSKKLCCEILQYEGIKEKKRLTTNEEAKEIAETSDILLWAIFADRKEIAEICWIRGEDHLFSGLVCSVLLQKLSKKAKNVDEQNLSTDLAQHAKLFEERCIRIMDELYVDNTKEAVEAMDDEAMIWGVQSSPLTIAYENGMYDVVAHICSRKNMNRAWYNKLAPDLKPFFKVMFFTMLVIYSAFVLTSIYKNFFTIGEFYEIYVYAWATGDFIEELISCFGYLGSNSRFHRGHFRRLKRYVNDFWNEVDLLSYALLIAALFVRHIPGSTEHLIARRTFALSLLVMYLRFLEVFLVHRTLGPTLIMIKEMLKDLMHFMLIVSFLIVGVGIYYHAILYRDDQKFWSGNWTEWRIWEVLYYPYWQIYTDLNMDYLHVEGGGNCNASVADRCAEYDWSVVVVAAGYVLFMDLLLVNLVIAMFSYTFERVQQNSEKLWWYERYTAVHDYQCRIPAPFNLFFLPYRVYTWCKRCCCCSQKDKDVTSEDVGNKDNKDMNAKEYRRELQKIIACSIYNKI